jgi:formylglycine-generating enzyme required for sulfatase activity
LSRTCGRSAFPGFTLTQALRWHTTRRDDISQLDQGFIELSRKTAQWRKLRVRALVAGLAVAIAAALAAWLNEEMRAQFYVPTLLKLKESFYWFKDVRVLAAEAERTLKTGGPPFKECTGCPEMLLISAGEFTMGSSDDEKGHQKVEGQQLKVVLANRFAVAKFELTFDEWDACVAYGDCDSHISPSDWGRGRQPTINVSWDDAKTYVAWLSRVTGKPYRLLTEAEYEYATRAGTETAYPWGNDIGENNANCRGCGSQWDGKQTAPVGSFSPNSFGLHDMAGNVWEWTEDCWHPTYDGVPADGSAWTTGDCSLHVFRGGSWNDYPQDLRSAVRDRGTTGGRDDYLGFRVGRTLLPP